ncbi:histidine phosphatase family protein [Nonomuraea sp. K274]|uniref:Histidine phosphatase family protein n=1 Tax=Nonomuraea cypriaca TaxID=1187855 RepID=A0A931F3E3_9ACTN|nr:histidine phosphatase family protein [Nonomuraea cypriaca]MBF8193879.1 histidine phosphatase family protein [Nonomuraea cypriaca]
MTVFYVVQHAEKAPDPGDPGLTDLGLRQAARTALWFRDAGLTAVFSSPMRRAQATAEAIAAVAGLPVVTDVRLRERMNWDGAQPIGEFLAEWAASVRDRSFVPRTGDSSDQAAARFLAFLQDHAGQAGPIAVCTHGGVTVDLLRTLAGDQALDPRLLAEGVPACAITTLDGPAVRGIASTRHLEPRAGT